MVPRSSLPISFLTCGTLILCFYLLLLLWKRFLTDISMNFQINLDRRMDSTKEDKGVRKKSSKDRVVSSGVVIFVCIFLYFRQSVELTKLQRIRIWTDRRIKRKRQTEGLI